MQCPHCSKEIDINREFCPGCGKRVNVAFSEIAASVQDDAAMRRRRLIEESLRWGTLVLVIAVTVIWALNDHLNRPLTFDGADIPALDVPPPKPGKAELLLKPEVGQVEFQAPAPGLPRVFAYRLPPVRDSVRDANGFPKECVDAVRKGLAYLSKNQLQDGSWSSEGRKEQPAANQDEWKWGKYRLGPTGMTALVVLAFLGEGETWLPNDAGKVSDNGKKIQKAVEFLIKSQDETNGRFGPLQGQFIYNHCMATLAVVEAAGMTGDPFLRESAQKGLDLIQRLMQAGPNGALGVEDKVNEPEDIMPMGWAVQALAAGQEANFSVKPEVLEKALGFFQKITDKTKGEVAFNTVDTTHFGSQSPTALLCRIRLGESAQSPDLKIVTKNTMQNQYQPKVDPQGKWGNGWREGQVGADDKGRAQAFQPYRLYYASSALFMVGGDDWKAFSGALFAAYPKLQNNDGGWYGNDTRSLQSGPIFSTALSILALQSCYRQQ